MKNLSNLFLLSVAVVFTACQTQNTEEVKEAIIKYIPFQTETAFTITCNNYESYYAKENKVKRLTLQNDINQLTSILFSLKRVDDGLQPDVRAQIMLTNTNGKIDTICLGSAITRYKNISYETSSELINFVQK
ncbi:hypothetical protein [Mucilaginibacter gynuensis]